MIEDVRPLMTDLLPTERCQSTRPRRLRPRNNVAEYGGTVFKIMKINEAELLMPANSYEVSYVLSIKKPNLNTGFKNWAVLAYERRRELDQWAKYYCDAAWIKEHR